MLYKQISPAVPIFYEAFVEHDDRSALFNPANQHDNVDMD